MHSVVSCVDYTVEYEAIDDRRVFPDTVVVLEDEPVLGHLLTERHGLEVGREAVGRRQLGTERHGLRS